MTCTPFICLCPLLYNFPFHRKAVRKPGYLLFLLLYFLGMIQLTVGLTFALTVLVANFPDSTVHVLI
jgi:hypothetical protein